VKGFANYYAGKANRGLPP